LEPEGIPTVFIGPLFNNSYQPGVENVVYNAVVKYISMYKRVRLVSNRKDADAILTGTVTGASASPGSHITGNQVRPFNTLSTDMLVATNYNAALTCKFSLDRKRIKYGQSATYWVGELSRSMNYPANNQAGILGTTSTLINESEFERALGDLAELVAKDLHQAILDRF